MDEVGRDIHLKRKDWNIDGQTFDLATQAAYYPDLFLPLLGEHQAVNAATAIACIERIRQAGYSIPRTSIYDGLKEVRWPGRMQVVGRSPVILLDGAHSPTSAEALCTAIREVFRYRRLILVVGLMRTKTCKPSVRPCVHLRMKLLQRRHLITRVSRQPKKLRGHGQKVRQIAMSARMSVRR